MYNYSSKKTKTFLFEVYFEEKNDGSILIGLITRWLPFILFGNIIGLLVPLLLSSIFLLGDLEGLENPLILISWIFLIIYIAIMIGAIVAGARVRYINSKRLIRFDPNENAISQKTLSVDPDDQTFVETKLSLLDEPVIKLKRTKKDARSDIEEIRIETTNQVISLGNLSLYLVIVDFFKEELGLKIEEEFSS